MALLFLVYHGASFIHSPISICLNITGMIFHGEKTSGDNWNVKRSTTIPKLEETVGLISSQEKKKTDMDLLSKSPPRSRIHRKTARPCTSTFTIPKSRSGLYGNGNLIFLKAS